jgi:hypothetical protein
MNNVNRRQLRTLVRGAYDVQKLRIEMGNRIVANFKAKLGQEPGKREDSIDPDAQGVLNSLRKSYRKITDGVKSFPRQSAFDGDEVISSYTENTSTGTARGPTLPSRWQGANALQRNVKSDGLSLVDIHRIRRFNLICRFGRSRATSRRKGTLNYTDKDGKRHARRHHFQSVSQNKAGRSSGIIVLEVQVAVP